MRTGLKGVWSVILTIKVIVEGVCMRATNLGIRCFMTQESGWDQARGHRTMDNSYTSEGVSQ